jgi:hypothetical protein
MLEWAIGRMRSTWLTAALFLLLPLLAGAGPASPRNALPRSEVPPAVSRQAMVVAEASCASLCRQRHNQCRIQSRGASKCDADLQRCLNGCLASKRR